MKYFAFISTLLCLSAYAGQVERQKAWVIHNRIAGVPPTPNMLISMEQDLIANNMDNAVQKAMAHPNFTNIVLKNWFKPWSNQTKSTAVPLNDFVATAVGLIRDNMPFDQILYGDVLYHATAANIANVDPYAPDSNNHFMRLEQNAMDWVTPLRRDVQSNLNGIPANTTAGAITTRAFGEAYFKDGTNRRMTRYVFMNFLCRDFEQLHDVSIADFRVRRDVERAPGEDSRTYKNKCVGCHAGQDALGGAWAYFNFSNNQVTYTAGQVQNKINQNAQNYPDGYVTIDDSWLNLWAKGQNAVLGWDPGTPTSGNGPRSFGRMMA
ncbi:MAG: hypothetical protein K2P81_17745, partial [Bacteriovoracaceae bacterium]|nr:hypothetical protein [Bacteriovoracaceae bacterium]